MSAFCLGPLERRVLESIYENGHTTVREIVETENLGRKYNTVMTTVDRLFKKGFLSRKMEGKKYRYSPVESQPEIEKRMAIDIISYVVGSDTDQQLPLSYLVDQIVSVDPSLLDQLQLLIDNKKRELSLRTPE